MVFGVYFISFLQVMQCGSLLAHVDIHICITNGLLILLRFVNVW